MDTTELQEARVLLHRILRAMNALPNHHIPNEEAFPNTYAIAEQVTEHLRHWHPTTPEDVTPMSAFIRPCPFPDQSIDGPPCGQPLEPRGLIAGSFSPKGNELFRWDCPHGHTILGEFTGLMGDEDEDEDGETDDPGHPIDDSPSYRDSMNDAGRGHLLREGSAPAYTVRREAVLQAHKIDTSRTKARVAPPALTGAPEAPQNYRLEQLYICTHGGHVFEEGRREAEGTLHGPDGRMVPGCFFCAMHARAIIAEYAEKLGETWYFRRFVPANIPWDPPRQTPPSALRSVYVAGVREISEDECEQVDDDDDAQFWSVYGVHNGDRFGFFDGASECLSDWPTREQAEAAAVRVVLGQYEARDEGKP